MSPENLQLLLSAVGVILGLVIKHFFPALGGLVRPPAPVLAPVVVNPGQAGPGPQLDPDTLEKLVNLLAPTLHDQIDGLGVQIRRRLAERVALHGQGKH